MKVDKVVVTFIIITILEILGLVYFELFGMNVSMTSISGLEIIASILGFIILASRVFVVIYHTAKSFIMKEQPAEVTILLILYILSTGIRLL